MTSYTETSPLHEDFNFISNTGQRDVQPEEKKEVIPNDLPQFETDNEDQDA